MLHLLLVKQPDTLRGESQVGDELRVDGVIGGCSFLARDLERRRSRAVERLTVAQDGGVALGAHVGDDARDGLRGRQVGAEDATRQVAYGRRRLHLGQRPAEKNGAPAFLRSNDDLHPRYSSSVFIAREFAFSTNASMCALPTCAFVSSSIAGSDFSNSSISSSLETPATARKRLAVLPKRSHVGGRDSHVGHDVAPARQQLIFDEAHVHRRRHGDQLLPYLLHGRPVQAALEVHLVLEDAVENVGARVAAEGRLGPEERPVDVGYPDFVYHQMREIARHERRCRVLELAGVPQVAVHVKERLDAVLLLETIEIEVVRRRPVGARQDAHVRAGRTEVEDAAAGVDDGAMLLVRQVPRN